MTDMNALIELQQSLTFLGQIGGLALPCWAPAWRLYSAASAAQRAPAWPARRAPAFCVRIPPSSAR